MLARCIPAPNRLSLVVCATLTSLGLTGAQALAAPNCVPNLADEPAQPREVSFDPLLAQAQFNFTLTLENPQDQACRARLDWRVDGFSGNWPADSALVLRRAGRDELMRVTPRDAPAQSRALTVTVPPGQTEILQLAVTMTSGPAPLASGDYQAAIKARLWPAGRDEGEPAQLQRLTVAYRAEPSIRLTLSESTRDTTISFAELAPGARRTFGVLVSSTDAYTLAVSSQSNWTLRRLTPDADARHAIPYQFTVDGAAANGMTRYRKHYQRPEGGIRAHTFGVRIKNFGFVPYGRYRDIITITASVKI